MNISAGDTVLPFLHTDLQSAATGLGQIRSCRAKLSGSLNDPTNKVKIFLSLIYSNIQHTFLISFEIMRDKKRWTETGWEAVWEWERMAWEKRKRKNHWGQNVICQPIQTANASNEN